MRVCFLLGKLTTNGGIGRAVSVLANQLVKKGICVHILSYYNDGQDNLYHVDSEIHLGYLQSSYKSMSKFMLSGGEKVVREYILKYQIDVLVACGALYFPVCVRAVNRTRVRCICWEHTAPKQNTDYRGQAMARLYGIKRSDLNIVLTRRALDIYINEYNAKNTIQIYNPVDDVIISHADEYRVDSKRIISVGRLSYPKNFQLAVRIASEVLPQNPDWSWDIYGQGEDYDELNCMIQNYGLGKQMKLRGQVNNLYELYNQYSFMVMTSRFEGFPMTLLEGMGNGLPLISFDIETGPNEIINNGMNGFIVPSGNSQLLVDRIQKMMSDEQLRKSISRRNKERAKDFSTTSIVQQWSELLKML